PGGAHRFFLSLRGTADSRIAVALRKIARGALEVAGVHSWRDAIADPGTGSFEETVAGSGVDAFQPAVESFGRALRAAALAPRRSHAFPERERFFRDGRSRRRAMTRFARESDLEREPSLVRDRHRVPGTAHARGRSLARSASWRGAGDRKSTRLNSSHRTSSYAVFCVKKKKPACGCAERRNSPSSCHDRSGSSR